MARKWTVAEALEVLGKPALTKEEKLAKIDLLRRFPLFSTASKDEILMAMGTRITPRVVERILRGDELEDIEDEVEEQEEEKAEKKEKTKSKEKEEKKEKAEKKEKPAKEKPAKKSKKEEDDEDDIDGLFEDDDDEE